MLRFKDLSISRKIIAASLAINIIGVIVMGAVTYDRSKALQEKSAAELLDTISDKYASEMQIVFNKTMDTVRTLAQVMQQYNDLPIAERRTIYNNMLKGALENNQTFTSIWTCWLPDALDAADANFAHTQGSDASGRYIPNFSKVNGSIQVAALVDYETQGAGDYFLIPYKTGKESVINPYTYTSGGKQVLLTSISVPIINNGKVVGVVGADIELSSLQAITSTIQPYGNGIAALFSNSGIVSAHFDPSRIGKQMRESEVDIMGADVAAQVAEAVKQGKNLAFTLPASATGTSMMLSFTSFPIGSSGTPWTLAVGAPVDTIMAPVARMLNYTLIIGAIVIAFVLAGMVTVALSIARPVKMLTAGAMRVAEGNLDTPLYVDQKDEIGKLSQALITMVEHLKSKIAEADVKSAEAGEKAKQAQVAVEEATAAKAAAERARREGMLAAAAQLESVVGVVSQASSNLTHQIRASEQGASNQAARVTETATAMEEMNSTVLEVAKSAGQTSDLSAATRQEAENGATVVQKSVQSIQSVQTQAMKLKEDMATLNEHAQSISQIMGVISDIADQTNLLALNAAIEAARAGDAGRGFAVVADEVRKLAEKTMDSTAVVSKAITSIQSSAAQSMTQMEHSTTTIDEATAFAQQSGESLAKIVQMMDTTADQVRAIATAAEQQSATSEEINRSISDINGISTATAHTMHEAAQVVNELSEQARVLSTLLTEMKNS